MLNTPTAIDDCATTSPPNQKIWDLLVAELGTVTVASYAQPVIIISAPSEAEEAYRAVDKAMRATRGAQPTGQFTVRRDFDCGIYCNAWSAYVVRPDGQHIANLQFSLDDESKAQAIADAMNQALADAFNRCAPAHETSSVHQQGGD